MDWHVLEHQQFYADHLATNDNEFDNLLEQGWKNVLTRVFSEGRSALHMAVIRLDKTLVRNILREAPHAIHMQDGVGLTPLMTACIIEAEAENFNALREIFFMILKLHTKRSWKVLSTTNMGYTDRRGHTALSHAICFSNLFFARELLRKRPRLKMPELKELSLLLYFSVISSEVVVITPPVWADSIDHYKRLHSEVAYLLCYSNESPLVKDMDERTPLFNAIATYNATLFKILMRIDSQDNELVAVRKRLKLKARKGASPTEIIATGNNPVYAAMCHELLGTSVWKDFSRDWMLRELIKSGADINKTSETYFFQSPLQLLLEYLGNVGKDPHLPTIAWTMIDAGADLSYVTPENAIHLHSLKSVFESALLCGDAGILEHVITSEVVNLNAPCIGLDGQTPLAAIIKNYRLYDDGNRTEVFEVLDLLVKYGARIEWDVPDDFLIQYEMRHFQSSHLTDLIIKIMDGENPEDDFRTQVLVAKLVELGADVDFHRGEMPNFLIGSARRDLVAICRKLVEYGADLGYSYQLSACSKLGKKPHRLIATETVEEAKAFKENSSQPDPNYGILLDCDICAVTLNPNDGSKICENSGSCATAVCFRCYMFVQHSNEETELLSVAKRGGNCGLINMLLCAHSRIGRTFIENDLFKWHDVFRNAGIDDHILLKNISARNLESLGLPSDVLAALESDTI